MECYKLCRLKQTGEMVSLTIDVPLTYEVGKKTVPYGGTRLFAFKTFEDALRFSETLNLNARRTCGKLICIVKGIGIQDKSIKLGDVVLYGSFSMSKGDIEGWWRRAREGNFHGYRRLPAGTVFMEDFIPKEVAMIPLYSWFYSCFPY